MDDVEDGLEIESLDLEGQGVAHRPDGKVVFVEGALPGERVSARVSRRKNNWEQAQVQVVLRESSQRVRPACPHFGLHAGACGGCKMQHLHAAAQVAVKQRVLEDNLWHLAKVRPGQLLRPIEGPAWGYRQRARLSVRHVVRKGTVLVGFHERKSRYVADMAVCPVLPAEVSALLMPLRRLIGAMDQRDRLPQIELAAGDTVTALVLRHLEPLSEPDLARLRAFAAEHGVQWWLQPKGPDSVHRLDEGGPELAYTLAEFGIVMPFKPTDFTQVNHQINRVLVSRALRLLEVQPGERVIDWFCGLGNFTLPMARMAGSVLGLEGDAGLIDRARANAAANGLANARFGVANLAGEGAVERCLALAGSGKFSHVLLDPPRTGAADVLPAVARLAPHRLVYVSCHPGSLARDLGILVSDHGFSLRAAGIVDMFPHTSHVESVAVLDGPGVSKE